MRALSLAHPPRRRIRFGSNSAASPLALVAAVAGG
jgi:hypothetical protein